MDKFIEVHDEILPKELENAVESLILDIDSLPFFPLYYQSNSTFKSTDPQFTLIPGLVHHFKGGPSSDYEDFLSQILYTFCSKVNIIIHKFFQGRVYVDLPSPKPGLDLPPHNDMVDLNHWVLLYYINDSDGDTVLFKEDKKTELKIVTPKKGRMIFFDGSIPHCGSRSFTNTRSTINFNFIGNKL
jgi:hypothetical protein